MAQIKFYRGSKQTYLDSVASYSDGIFFATDRHEIMLNGTTYGVGEAVSDITFDAPSATLNVTLIGNSEGGSPKKIVIGLATDSANGLMSAKDKAALDELIGDGTGSVADQIKKAIDALKETINKYTVNGQAISTNPVLNGGNIKLDGYSATDGETEEVSATDTVNQAIAKVENANKNTQEELEGFKASVNQPNGIAGLGENGKIDPSLVDGVVGHVLGLEQFVENASLPAASVDNVNKYYFVTDESKIAKCVENEGVYSWEKTDPQPQVIYNRRGEDEKGHANTLYRWDGSQMTAVSDPIAIGVAKGTAYDGAQGQANRDALTSIPSTVVTTIAQPVAGADNVTVQISDSDKDGASNQFTDGDGISLTFQAATDSAAGMMSSTDKSYIEAIKDILGEDAEALDVLTRTNAGIGILANYTVAAAAAAIAPTDTINQALGKLEKTLQDLNGSGDTSIKNQIKEAIDGVLDSISYDSETHTITFIKSDGSTKVPVVIDTYVGENAIAVSDAVDNSKTVSLVIDPAAESFLTQSASGLKLAGVQDAINAAVSWIEV